MHGQPLYDMRPCGNRPNLYRIMAQITSGNEVYDSIMEKMAEGIVSDLCGNYNQVSRNPRPPVNRSVMIDFFDCLIGVLFTLTLEALWYLVCMSHCVNKMFSKIIDSRRNLEK